MSRLSDKVPIWYALIPVAGLLLLSGAYLLVSDAMAHPPHKVTCLAHRSGDNVTITYIGGMQQSWVGDLTMTGTVIPFHEKQGGEGTYFEKKTYRPRVGEAFTFQCPEMVQVECHAIDEATRINYSIYKKIL